MKKKRHLLIPYLLQYKWYYVAGILVLLAVDLANLYIPQFTGEIVDGLADGSLDMTGVLKLLGGILCAALIMMGGRFGWRYFIFGASRRIEYKLRNDMFAHLETLSARYYNGHKTGELMSYFTNDLEAIRVAVGMAVITTFDALIMTIMVLIKMMLHVDVRLTVFAFIPLILVSIGCYFFGMESKKRQLSRQEAFSKLSDQVQESIAGIRVIKAFVQEEKDFETFCRVSENSMEKNLAVVRLRAVMGPFLDVVTGISLLLTLLLGGKMVLNGTVSIGEFVAFNSYIGMLVWPMIACGDCINHFTQASAALKRVGNIFAETPDIIDQSEAATALTALKGEIECNNLTFSYPDSSQEALKGIHLKVKEGEMLAILGRTGSGKTTLADLLLRVYDCKESMIKIDGIPINKIPLSVLHRDISYVTQENFLFSDTLEENLAFGLEERIADGQQVRERIHEAAKDACIHDNIMEFPMQYETIVGERGVTLSGGQKQRSSIARALLKDAPILILDDSLSAVDTDTEEKILNNLLRIRKGKTTIVIAHRVSTLQKADHIAVLSEGRLSEYGTHEELIKNNGFYAHIYKKQQLEQELAGL